MTSREVVAAHRAAGRAFTAAGISGFVREAGDGETALCMHGVPTSSFLYRKVLTDLAARDVRASRSTCRAWGSPTVRIFLQEDQAPAIAGLVAGITRA